MTTRSDPLASPAAVPREPDAPATWTRAAPIALGLLAAVVYLWNLASTGYANTYYSAAAQAASQSWSAMFFGSIDAANFITVDKPPVALWVMGLSVRLLGLSPFAVLLPEALAGIASVLVLHATVRRSFGPVAALVAGVGFALTPVAALMFRYNNPDAVLTLLLVAAAWALVRGLGDERLRWPILAGALVGFAFLTKYLQAYVVLPAFAVTYLVAARGDVRRRLVGLAAAGVAVAASSSWWVAIVEILPAASRPYIGGSSNNSALDLVLGYDGLGRIFGGGGPGGRRRRTGWPHRPPRAASAVAPAASAGARVAASAARPARSACSTRNGRARSAGSCRRPRPAWSPGCCPASGPRAPTHGGPASCCGACGVSRTWRCSR